MRIGGWIQQTEIIVDNFTKTMDANDLMKFDWHVGRLISHALYSCNILIVNYLPLRIENKSKI